MDANELFKNQPNWVPLQEVLDIINHPNFHWSAGFTDLKYLNLRIDTRDNCCILKDRNDEIVDLAALKAKLNKPIMAGMNENVKVILPVSDFSGQPVKVNLLHDERTPISEELTAENCMGVANVIKTLQEIQGEPTIFEDKFGIAVGPCSCGGSSQSDDSLLCPRCLKIRDLMR